MISKLMNMKSKEFFNKLLNGVALGIVVGLLPNAILGEIFKSLAPMHSLFQTASFVVSSVQSSVPILIGCLIGAQFGFTAIEIASLGATTFIGSGVVKLAKLNDKPILQLAGIGDLINIIIVAMLAVMLIQALKGKLGSLAMILVPVIVITTVGTVGQLLLPSVSQISLTIGQTINHFTTLQPLVMSILISVSFAIIIISPMSSVAIGVTIGLTGLSSGAANVGIATCAMTLVLGSMRANNKLGVTLAVFFGSMKVFMPNWLKHPILNVPIILNAILGGVIAYVFNIQGTPQSSGFGFSGLVGPINAFKLMGPEHSAIVKVLLLFVAYFVLTTIGAFIIDYVLVKIVKLYKHNIYEFE